MKDVLFPGRVGNADRTRVERRVAKAPRICRGSLSPRFVPTLEVGELDGQDDGLERIETRVHADALVDVTLSAPVSAEQADSFRRRVVGAEHHASVARRA